jgi:transcriptional regulator with PAS, ATPase and Fis domain
MVSVVELLNKDGFLRSLFKSIPCGVFIVDKDNRVQAVNRALEQIIGFNQAGMIGLRGGEILNCLNASKDPRGCGYSTECNSCVVRRSAIDAIKGARVYKNRAGLQLDRDGQVLDMQILVSAAPFDHDGERYAAVIIEDITELSGLRRRLNEEHSFAGIIGNDNEMKELFQTIEEVADVKIPILIQGESGTGKELVASAIHNKGPRAQKPFVPVNCAALPEGLIESELFGHVKGAFTGAVKDKRGRFDLADKGTLFLDEVADLPRPLQAKLLRVLQEGSFERVGDEKTHKVDVRIISATNRDLKRAMEKDEFREDLYYRLNVIPIYIPPLRKRKNDVPLLVEAFLGKAAEDGQAVCGISKEALSVMTEYSWPGNIRELQSAIRFAIVKSRGQDIRTEHLPMELQNAANSFVSQGPARKLSPDAVRDALAQTGGNKAKAARLLNVGRATLYRFLAELKSVS